VTTEVPAIVRRKNVLRVSVSDQFDALATLTGADPVRLAEQVLADYAKDQAARINPIVREVQP
jgi:hypothetical protein